MKVSCILNRCYYAPLLGLAGPTDSLLSPTPICFSSLGCKITKHLLLQYSSNYSMRMCFADSCPHNRQFWFLRKRPTSVRCSLKRPCLVMKTFSSLRCSHLNLTKNFHSFLSHWLIVIAVIERTW